MIAVFACSFKCEDIQLFHYIHPSHSEQVAYIVGIAQYMMEKREWNRQFTINEEKCPQFTTEICPDGKVCKPPGLPPKEPPNVCDMDQFHTSSTCQPGGDCYDDGTCPVKVCDVPLELRTEAAGGYLCEKDECKVDNPPAHCEPVTRCDLKIYEGHLDQIPGCETEDPCETNPDLCVNICDITGDYSPCGYMDCYKFPFLPYCIKLPPPPPCSVESGKTVSDNTCCVGLDCITPFDRCLWGQNIGKRIVDKLTVTNASNDSHLNTEGNPVLDCITNYEQVEKQTLMFECFKDGVLAEGFELVNEKEIESIVQSHVKEGDVVVVGGQAEEGDQKMTVTMTNTTTDSVNGAMPLS